EPRAPRPDLRMEAVRRLNQAGIDAGVSCSPVIPEITDSPRDLEAVVRATAEAGGKHIFANPLFLKPCSAAVFMPFLEKEFPRLVGRIHGRSQGKSESQASPVSQGQAEGVGLGDQVPRSLGVLGSERRSLPNRTECSFPGIARAQAPFY